MKSLVILKTLYAEATEIGSGAIISLDKASPPILNLLKRAYLSDKHTLAGDIDHLFTL